MRQQAGLTLIELMVTLTVLGLLTALAIPSFRDYTESTRVRTAAESFAAGLNTARLEAVRRNANVDFIATTSLNITPAANGTINVPLSDTGTSWVVRAINPDAAVGGWVFVDGKQAGESSGRADGTSPIRMQGFGDGPGEQIAGVRFSSMSRVTFLDDAADPVVSPTARFAFSSTAGACAPAGPLRCPLVIVSVSGQVRICDPEAAAGDTRAC